MHYYWYTYRNVFVLIVRPARNRILFDIFFFYYYYFLNTEINAEHL